MPTITLNKQVFEQLLGKKLPLEQLKDRISMLGTGLEKIEGNEIHVEIFPNRPDMLSEQGLARSLSSFIGVKTGLRKYNIKKSGLKVIIDPSVTMRPYTACAIVKKLSFNDEKIREIMQAQEKLATTHGRNRKKSAYGIYPLTGITFPLNYIAKDPTKVHFRPLGLDHEILASQIEELHPKGKEYKEVAKGWKKYPFFIDNAGKIMCMLPYTNSHDTGKVDETTTEVFIECSGTDLQNVLVSLNIFVTMFADMGGEIYSLDMVYPTKNITTPNLTPRKMKLDIKYINQRLGLNLKDNQAKKLLERMGYGCEKNTILIPAYRSDVLHQVDLAEDIAIAYGYENFPEIIPKVATVGQEDPLEKFNNKIREILIGLQLIEVKNYHLITAKELNQNMNRDEKLLPLKNALGDYNHLRNAIIPSLLKTLAENQHNEYPQNIFEIGRTFFHDTTQETNVKETEKLAIALCHEKTDFTEIKQMLDLLFNTIDLSYTIKECTHDSYIPGRVGEIIVEETNLGFIGELHPQVLENWKLVMPTVVFELDLEKLFKLIK